MVLHIGQILVPGPKFQTVQAAMDSLSRMDLADEQSPPPDKVEVVRFCPEFPADEQAVGYVIACQTIFVLLTNDISI